MRLGERYLELVINRMKLVFSVESICTFGLLWYSIRIAEWLELEHFMYFRSVNHSLSVMSQVGIVVYIIAVGMAVYAIGEFIRRKFKLKSILGYDTSNDEVKQKIVSLMIENPNITAGEIADTFGYYIGHAEAYIRVLKKTGLIRSEGYGSNRRWIVTQ